MSIREQLPPEIKSKLRYLYYLPIDTIDYLLGKRDELTPPRILKLAGDGDFKEKGREVFRNFVDLCDITSNDLVLDVGCGIGRMAVPLTSYLTTGKYEGLDIIPQEIE
jgi:SAM-dependent methyltransferase